MENITKAISDIKDICIKKSISIACAESVTGGLLSYAFTRHPNASNYFKGTIIAYTNDIKISQLKVPQETIEQHSAVSQETAQAMAENIRKRFNADIGIATTGYAGPDDDKTKTGLVFISICNGNKTITKQLKLSGNRNEIQEKTVKEAINLLREGLTAQK